MAVATVGHGRRTVLALGARARTVEPSRRDGSGVGRGRNVAHSTGSNAAGPSIPKVTGSAESKAMELRRSVSDASPSSVRSHTVTGTLVKLQSATVTRAAQVRRVAGSVLDPVMTSSKKPLAAALAATRPTRSTLMAHGASVASASDAAAAAMVVRLTRSTRRPPLAAGTVGVPVMLSTLQRAGLNTVSPVGSWRRRIQLFAASLQSRVRLESTAPSKR
jgi:hypothetical protein